MSANATLPPRKLPGGTHQRAKHYDATALEYDGNMAHQAPLERNLFRCALAAVHRAGVPLSCMAKILELPSLTKTITTNQQSTTNEAKT